MKDGRTLDSSARSNAALAHAGILLGLLSRGLLGIVLALLILVTQRGKSAFVTRQATQALVYQTLGLVVELLLFLMWGVLLAGSIFVPTLINSANPEGLMPYTMIPVLLLLSVPLAVGVGWLLLGLYAAYQVWQGRDYSYPVIGRWIK